MQNKLKKLEWISQNSQNKTEVLGANKEIFKIQKNIEKLKDKKEILSFEKETTVILGMYNSVRNSRKSFLITTKDTTNENKKLQLLENYVLIASKYVEINYKSEKTKLYCEYCYPNLNEWNHLEDNFYSCSLCDRCIKLPDEEYSYKDMDRLNLSTRYKYSRKGHFKEAVEKFQAIQNVNIPPQLYTTLKRIIKSNGIKILKKEHILMFLSESDEDYTEFYGDINLIHYNLTGIKPPCISEYETELYSMFDKQDEVYEKLKNNKRMNSLNVYYKLMKMLQILGYKCNLDDFNMLKTREKILEHDESWKLICEELGWNYYPTI